jgi:hypothetical protein
MALPVHLLALITGIACACLLLRAWHYTRVPLLMWSGLAFVFFSLNNVGLIVDLHVLTELDLPLLHAVPSLIGVALLLGGLIWNAR